MKKIGYFSCIIFLMFPVGCSNNKKKNDNLLNASSFLLILTTIIEKEEDLMKGLIFFNRDKIMTLEKEYLVNPNNEDTEKASKTEKRVYKNIRIQEGKESYKVIGQSDRKTKKTKFKKVDRGKRISDAEGSVYSDFGGRQGS